MKRSFHTDMTLCAGIALALVVMTGFSASDAIAFDTNGTVSQRIYRLMAVGDSITEGGNVSGAVSYRYPLWEKLFAAGYLAEYVGSRTNESRIGALRHEGYSGKTAEFLAATVGKSFRQSPADIVLLHAGHNHSSEEQPVEKIVAATESLIGTFREVNPQVIVLLAQVIPSGKLPKYSYLPRLNEEVAKLAARLDTPKQPVILVNQAEGFDWSTDTVADKVHPNSRGAAKMADRWFTVLTNVMEQPKQSFDPKIVTYKKAVDRTPPTLFFLGTRDPLIPVKTACEFKAKIEQAGGRCELKLFEGSGHPIYEYQQGDSPYRLETLVAADAFLTSLGFIPHQPKQQMIGLR